MRSELIVQMLRFGAVGGVGFVVDGGLLWLLISLDFNPYLARALSFPVAVVVTWALNRNWTFRATRDASKEGQFRRYFGVQLIGSMANYLTYSAIIGLFGTASLTIFLGFSLGSFFGALMNFFGARHVAFRA
ncbi:GtrA family protein [Yoonia algicola]|uniref:GtrA family protein n=1 Tax=Yoonia algicola TaxID=3137368 RepID=A0AAN0ME23_9RHOB